MFGIDKFRFYLLLGIKSFVYCIYYLAFKLFGISIIKTSNLAFFDRGFGTLVTGKPGITVSYGTYFHHQPFFGCGLQWRRHWSGHSLFFSPSPVQRDRAPGPGADPSGRGQVPRAGLPGAVPEAAADPGRQDSVHTH